MSLLTLELPDETMAVLERVAKERGESAEVIAREWVQNDGENEEAVSAWMELAGIFNSQTPDLAERQDRNRAEESANNHDDDK